MALRNRELHARNDDDDDDLDVCQIAPKIFWIHYLVGVSHFAECCENWPVTVRGTLINLLKFSIHRWREKWKTDPESEFWIGSSPNVNQFFLLVGPVITPSFKIFNEIGSLLFE